MRLRCVFFLGHAVVDAVSEREESEEGEEEGEWFHIGKAEKRKA